MMIRLSEEKRETLTQQFDILHDSCPRAEGVHPVGRQEVPIDMLSGGARTFPYEKAARQGRVDPIELRVLLGHASHLAWLHLL